MDLNKSGSNKDAKLIHFFISGTSSGLGLSLYRTLSKKKNLITVLGRHMPINLRRKDIFLSMDLSSKIEHLSTGGGSCISFMSGEVMPALEAMRQSKTRYESK